MGRKTDFTKMSTLPKLPYKLNRILMEILASFFLELDNFILKCIWKSKWSAKTNKFEKVQERSICADGYKNLTSTSEMKAVLCWLKGGQMDRQTEKLGTDSHMETLAVGQMGTARGRGWGQGAG